MSLAIEKAVKNTVETAGKKIYKLVAIEKVEDAA